MAAVKQPPRNATRIIEVVRNFLAGRKIKPNLRYQDFNSARSQPPPNLPKGVAHKLNKNYYYTRDLRRLAQPPKVITKQSLLAAPNEIKQTSTAEIKTVTPGETLQWNENPF